MHVQRVIEQLGYSGSQVKIYLAALRMGETTIADIAAQVEMPRTTVTELMTDMHKHGLMNYYLKHGRKRWTAESPEKLLLVLKEKEAALQSILPSLHAMHHAGGEGRPNIKLYTGAEEIKLIMDDMIEAKHNIMALVSWDDFYATIGTEYMNDFIERRVKHFLKIKVITPRTESAVALKARDQKELRQTRFLPSSIELRRVSNFIYGSKVAIVSLNTKQPVGILIADPDVVHALQIYFDGLWGIAQ